jgi:hypothetical protein
MKAKRALAVVSVVAAAGVVPLVTATSAYANQSACVNYLGNAGYVIGPKVKAACKEGETLAGITVCQWDLQAIHVRQLDASEACWRAYK